MPPQPLPRSARAGAWLALLTGAALVWPQSLAGRVAYVRVSGGSMAPTLWPQDLAVVVRQPSYRVGDAVAYRVPEGDVAAGAVVIHRLVGGDGEHGFVTRGDALDRADSWHPRTGDVLGRVRLRAPGAGLVMAELGRPWALGLLVTGLTLLVLLWPAPQHRRRGAGFVLGRIGDSGPPPRRRARRGDPLSRRAAVTSRVRGEHVRRRQPHRSRPARRRRARLRRPGRVSPRRVPAR